MRDTRIINPDYNYPYEHQSSVGDILQVGDGSGMSSQPPTVSKTSSLSPPDVYLHFLPAILENMLQILRQSPAFMVETQNNFCHE